jgi:hypothetical protein
MDRNCEVFMITSEKMLEITFGISLELTGRINTMGVTKSTKQRLQISKSEESAHILHVQVEQLVGSRVVPPVDAATAACHDGEVI